MYRGTKQGIVLSVLPGARALPRGPSSWRTRWLFLLALAIAISLPIPELAAQGEFPHPKGCADDEIYISSQDWWLTTPGEVGQDGQPGEDFGHLHTELCFPHKATISGEMTLEVTSIMHHNPGDFYKLVIQIWAEGWKPDPLLCGEGSAVACKEFSPARTIATCEASGGTLIGEATCKWHDSLTFDTSIFPFDGWQQFRVRGKVDQADGSGMRTSTGLHAYLSNGKPISHVYENPDRLEGRGWYTDANYAVSNVKGLTAGPVSGLWAPWLEMKPGSGGIPVTSHRVALDAAIHAGDLGTELLDDDGPYEGRVMIDTTTLTNGWHKLFLRASQFEPISGSTNSSIFVVFFEVLNQVPPACDLVHIEPAVADSYVRGDTFQFENFGQDDDLVVKSSSSDYYTRRAYLRFDLSDFAASNLDSAVFTAYVHSHQTPGVGVPLDIYSVSSDIWDEDTITWNTEPEPGAFLGTTNVSDAGPVTFDITSHVESELGGDKQVSLVLVDDSGTNQMLRFRSRTTENDPPSLALVPALNECTPPGSICDQTLDLTTGEWKQISLACDPGTANQLSQVFGGDLTGTHGQDWSVFRRAYNDAAGDQYPSVAWGEPLEVGRGYWLKTLVDAQKVTVQGTYNVPVEVGLKGDGAGRYNLVGHPFEFDVCWADVEVINPAATVGQCANTPNCTLAEADAEGFMSRIAHKWTGANYAAFNGLTPGAKGTLVPWDGFWVGAFAEGIKLRIPANPGVNCDGLAETVSQAAVALRKSKNKKTTRPWYIRLTAETGDLKDPFNVLGQTSESIQDYDVHDLKELAPFGISYLSIVFSHADWGERSGDYTSDFHSLQSKVEDEWSFEVLSSDPEATVTLTWEGEESHLEKAFLVDTETRKRYRVKRRDSYTFTMKGNRRGLRWLVKR